MVRAAVIAASLAIDGAAAGASRPTSSKRPQPRTYDEGTALPNHGAVALIVSRGRRR